MGERHRGLCSHSVGATTEEGTEASEEKDLQPFRKEWYIARRHKSRAQTGQKKAAHNNGYVCAPPGEVAAPTLAQLGGSSHHQFTERQQRECIVARSAVVECNGGCLIYCF